MRLSHTTRVINKQKLNGLKRDLFVSIAQAPKYINRLKEKNKEILLDKLLRLNKKYIRFIKLDQVELCQERVADLQDQLQNAQEKRRHIATRLQFTNEKMLQLQEDISKVDRLKDTEKFHDLLARQTEMLRLENTTYKEFQGSLQIEKDIFTAYCNAIRASYEKQKYQSEYTKYFVSILGLLGVILGNIRYMKSMNTHKQDIKNMLEEKLEQFNKTPSMETGSNISGIIKWIGSVPDYVYKPIKPYVPSYSRVMSFPKDVYRYFTGKKYLS